MTRRGRRAAAVVAAALAACACVPPADAIETREFALDPGDGSDGGVEIDVDGRGGGQGSIRLTNKLDESLVLTLDAVPATAEPGGRVRLGGEPEPPSWLQVPGRVVLQPREQRTLPIRVADADLADVGASATAAVVARPAETPGSEGAAVIAQAALMVYLVSVERPTSIGGLGIAPWVGGVVLVLAVYGLYRALRGRESRSG